LNIAASSFSKVNPKPSRRFGVSYTLRLAADAIVDLRELDPWLQEETLDELETLLADPAQLRTDHHGEAVHDFDRRLGDTRHVIFIRLHRDSARQLLSVLAIIDHKRPWLQPD
jgi:hypothetical protein